MEDSLSKVRAVVLRIRQLLSCPVIWPREPWTPEMRDLLVCRWRETCEQFQLSDELSCFNILDESDEYDESRTDVQSVGTLGGLQWDCDNIEQWIARARQKYLSETRRFWDLVVAGPKLHAKHYPGPAMTEADIMRATQKHAISLLYPGISPSVLSEVLWEGLGALAGHAQQKPSQQLTEFWRSVFSFSRFRIAFDMMNPVGACYGELSTYLCFEVDASAAVAHAYPVSRPEAEEIAQGLPLVGVDDLQGFTERRSDWNGDSSKPWGTLRFLQASSLG